MPVFYSPEWVAAFNAALADLDVPTADDGPSLAAGEGRFRVLHVVHDGPGGAEQRVLLVLADNRLTMEIPAADDSGGAGAVNVTLSLPYADAVALSRGEVDPAALVGTGRVRVRGDLSVLIAAQALLSAAAPHLADLRAATTY